MIDVLQFALLGLGIGSVYVLLGAGLILVHRGSGTINLAHGHIAIAAACSYYELRDVHGVPAGLALAGAVLAGAGIGGLVHSLVMTPLRHATPIVRIIGTLGVLTIISEVLLLRYGTTLISSTPALPSTTMQIGRVVVGQQALWLAVIAAVVSLALAVISTRSRLGLAVTAAAENPRSASALGWSPQWLAFGSWALGGALAGLAGAVVPATTSGFFTPGSFGLLIVGALAVALFAGFRSYSLALVAGWVLGVAQSESTRYVSVTGVSDAIPFVAIVLVMVLRGRGLPVRGSVADRFPSVGTGAVRLPVVGAAVTSLCLLIKLGVDPANDFDLLQATAISAALATVGLSVVVLTGYAGQLSLAQMGLAGIGAYAAGRLVAGNDLPFPAAVAAGCAAAALAGVFLGLPALRTRGVNLTVVTFGMGFAVYAVLFSSTQLTGGNAQTRVPSDLSFFGVPVDSLLHVDNYAVLCLVALAVASILVANLRRSVVGRAMLAVRSNERAAAAIGVNVYATKLYAFAVSAAIAGLGGVMYAFLNPTILYQNLFGPFSSIEVTTVAVIGGLGWVMGPVWGSLLATGGIGVLLTTELSSGVERYVPLFGAVLMIALLIVSQNGVAAAVSRLLPKRYRSRAAGAGAELPASAAIQVERQGLQVEALTQTFGGITALADVSLRIVPGKVLGILGPNGAGKTTLIDAITGFVAPGSGSILLGARDITTKSVSARARLGVGRTFQSLELFDDLSVRENLQAACDRRSRVAYLQSLVWPGRPRLAPTAAAAVRVLELEDVLDAPVTTLSYGKRRLVAIARAVAAGPSVLLLDEPGAGLDETETAELGRLVRRLADDWGMAVLMVEHDVAMVLETSDVVHVLDFGRTIYTGDPSMVSSDPSVRQAYLGLPPAETDIDEPVESKLLT